MKVRCFDNHNRYDYTIGKYYFVEMVKYTDLLFNRVETYYSISDNFGEVHIFSQQGFKNHFISIAMERKSKLEKINL